MRILQLTSNDAITGGAIAITRLHEALQNEGHTSSILTPSKYLWPDGIAKLSRPLGWRVTDRATKFIGHAVGMPDVIQPSVLFLQSVINRFQPDLIHLHWTYSGGIPLSWLPHLTNQFPLVWTFHDMWAFTGGCTNSLGCNRWLSGCGNCPQWHGCSKMVSMPPLKRDRTHQLWRIKAYIYARSRFAIIAPSNWMVELAQKSPLLGGKRIFHIPNGLDTDFWKPLDKSACKCALDITPGQKVILYIGKPDNLFAYPGRKSVLLQALDEFRKTVTYSKHEFVLLLVGEGGQALKVEGYKVVAVRAVASAAMLRICYNAADVLLDPTQFDNFPGVIQEALACGTPIVASNVGGVPDLVQHMNTGYLAQPTTIHEFVSGLTSVLADPKLWQYLAVNARRSAVEKYNDRVVARSLVDVYKSVSA